MCEYCEAKLVRRPLIDVPRAVKAWIDPYDSLLVIRIGQLTCNTHITYCPKCGRSLRGGAINGGA